MPQAAERPRLFGADYSVYVRICRLTLLEKRIEHDLVPVDIFATEGVPGWYRERHPFGKIPAFEHDGFRLFETTAITRYVDEAFEGPALQPAGARRRAVMNQITGLLDAYAYRTLVWDIYVEAVAKPAEGKTVDRNTIEAALPKAETCLRTLSTLKQPGRWLLGDQLTLADLHAAPMFGYFAQAEEGRKLLDRFPEVGNWFAKVSSLATFAATEPSIR